MRLPRLAFILGLATISSTAVVHEASAAAGNDSCKVLTAESFGRIMGYAVTTAAASTKMSCFYQGPPHVGGQFTILTESASGPQADAMLNRRGSSPPPGSGLVGGTYRKGSVIFSLSIRSTDKAKLEALVKDVERNLK